MNLWVGRAKKLDDIDIPAIGSRIDVGEDPLHAVMDVEARNSGFDSANRVVMLREPHIFYRELASKPTLQKEAVRQGLAYPTWGEKTYPRDSYPSFIASLEIDERAAYRSCSWGLGQIMGFNSSLAGFDSPQAMVAAFAADEENQLLGMVNFIQTAGLDDELRDLQAATSDPLRLDASARFARGYNGPGYARNNYHKKILERYNWWRKKPDTPWNRSMMGQCKLTVIQ